jgi:serine/threonine protein kinase/Tol biopolymer transport system component
MTLAAGSKLGPYEILAQIGAGGMGEVYRAKDPRLSREVAIKVLPASFSEDTERLRRFEQEAKAAGVLNHPNVTAVYDIGTNASDGAPYVVQELLEGETLRSVLAGGKLSARKTIDYSLQIVRGLAAAHERGIVHRDLKPENVFVTNDGRVKILDFGLAKLTHTEERGQVTNLPTATAGTEPGVIMGTLGYMSPEQVRGKPADARSDIFSFGAILYEMVSGRRAFHGDSAADTMSAILKEDPPDLSVTGQNVPPALERIIRHCLEKSPEQRFHSAHDLGFDLESLSGVSASGQPAAAGASRRFAGRGLAIPVAIALLALAVGYALGHRKSSASKPSTLTYSQLTFLQYPVFNARFSPDGKTVVFSAAPSGNAPQIFSLRPDYPGGTPTGQPGMELLSISSKGELAVLTKPRFLRHSVFLGTLARMPLEGGAPREIVDGVREADWNPDGSDLAVTRDVNGKDRLEFPVGKVLAETGGYFSNPRFSPRGDRIAFFEHPIKYDDRGSIAVVDLSGKKTVLSEGYGIEEGLAWSRDGREVLFSGGPDYHDVEIYGVGLDGRRRSAAQSAGGITILDVSSDGRWLASRDDSWRDLYGLGAGQDKERNLSWLELSYPVAFTPDGKTLLFTEESGRLGNYYSTCVRQTDGSPVVRLGDGTALDIARDGTLVLSSVPTDPAQLVVYPTGAGQPRKLERGGLLSYEGGGFFPDGRRIFACGHEAGHAIRCYVQEIAGGNPRPITPEGTTDGFISPDGTQILVRESKGGLNIYPVSGGAPRGVPGATPNDAVLRWMSDGKSILIASLWSEVPLRVDKLDLATGRREPFKTLGPAELTGAVHVTPVAFTEDGKSHAYAVRRMASHLFLVQQGE